MSENTQPRRIHPIEAESYRIMRSLIDLSHLGGISKAVTERVIHASADLEYANSLLLDEDTLHDGLDALRSGARIVADVKMVAAGITSAETLCFVSDTRAAKLSAESETGITRSAAGFRVAYEEVGKGAIWVIGNAPTALFEIMEMEAEPALVVGLPVGFVGASESKAALAKSGLPCLTNVGMKGGSAVAAAAVNALLYFDESESEL